VKPMSEQQQAGSRCEEAAIWFAASRGPRVAGGFPGSLGSDRGRSI
jgi:hypothetical protein